MKCFAVRWFYHDVDGTPMYVSEGRIHATNYGVALRALRSTARIFRLQDGRGIVPQLQEVASSDSTSIVPSPPASNGS